MILTSRFTGALFLGAGSAVLATIVDEANEAMSFAVQELQTSFSK